MIKKIILAILSVFFLAFLARPVLALENKFGIHILETSDLEKARQLVNSNGGDWGYVTQVLRDDDLNHDKWQSFFNDCRKLHLIPIIRIATHMEKTYWTKPRMEELHRWPDFLKSLNWPTKQQIVVIFNEPNHAKEWGGQTNPRDYALVLDRMIALFKDADPNFFVLNAGFDQAAPTGSETMDEGFYLSEMQKAVPDIFEKLDGWASHSYPNHGFIGSPDDTGRRSIRGYEWELAFLKDLGVQKELPIYITETGWPHFEGLTGQSPFYKSDNISELLKKAFNVWLADLRVKSITPFVLNYPAEPFDHFSWIKNDGSNYPQYDFVTAVAKPKGNPEQVEKYEIFKLDLADLLPTNYKLKAKITIKNTGQWIMGERDNFNLNVEANNPDVKASSILLKKGDLLYPGSSRTIDFFVETGTQSANLLLNVAGQPHTIYIFKPWDLKNTKVNLLQQLTTKIKLWWLDFKD